MGQPVTVTVDALPGRTLNGRISRIGQRARTESGQIEVEAAIAPEPGLRSGMLGTMALNVAGGAARADGFARIPAEALLEASGGRATVMRLDPGDRVRRTPVGFGGFDGDHALVSGLESGARVVTAGAGYASDGERVSVVDPTRLGASR